MKQKGRIEVGETHDIFLRAHTVVLPKTQTDEQEPPQKKRPAFHGKKKSGKWPTDILVFDCESRTDTGQQLTFGFYCVLRLIGDQYKLTEEGAFFDDDLPTGEREILEAYTHTTDTELKTFPPRFPLYSSSEFVKAVFYSMARQGAMIVGFNIDLTGEICTRWNERESTWRKQGHAPTEVQTRTNRDDAATD